MVIEQTWLPQGPEFGTWDRGDAADRSAPPRVAYFPDSFHEVNGVAHTSRHFEAYARGRNLPFLCVRAGDREERLRREGNLWTLELPRGFLSIAIEKDLRFDPAFPRHVPAIEDALAEFRPDLIHITGPSEIGMTAAALARWMKLPLAASWHTNVHEYVARRSELLLRMLSEPHAWVAGQRIQEIMLDATAWFYAMAGVLYAPNDELCARLETATGRRCFRMPRGVDADLFHPSRRTRPQNDGELILGFTGRLSVEKNVALLAQVQEQLEQRGLRNFRFMIVGHGAEEPWLRARLHRAVFTGVLRGEELARAYADMDLFVFPSHTDTFGNVVLEALASGVPAIVTHDGGPRTIVHDGVTGRVAHDHEFADAIAEISSDRSRHAAMRCAARKHALTASWDAVFDGVYAGYATIVLNASAGK
ncbi:MAG: glycosyltransferase [Acidobacteriota bacterium]